MTGWANVIEVVKAGHGESSDIARLVIYVTDKTEYRERTKEVGERYRKHMGKHFPAMVLVQVAGLLDDRAKVEIECRSPHNPRVLPPLHVPPHSLDSPGQSSAGTSSSGCHS